MELAETKALDEGLSDVERLQWAEKATEAADRLSMPLPGRRGSGATRGGVEQALLLSCKVPPPLSIPGCCNLLYL